MSDQSQYYYYNSYGKRVTVTDPGNLLVVIYSNSAETQFIREELEKMDLKIVHQGRLSEKSDQLFFHAIADGKILNRYEEGRLTLIKRIEGVNAVGFQLDSVGEQLENTFYSGILTISFSESVQEAVLRSELEEMGLTPLSCKYIGGMGYLFVECPSNAGTDLINEYLLQVSKLKDIDEVAPEIFGFTN